jgi:hypothetical protein
MDNMKLTIEELKEKIDNTKTKEYFNEVYSCYVNGNYRTAISALYNVFLLDLFFKLETLMYLGDEKAYKKYTTLVKKFNKKDDSFNQSWEDELRKYAYEETYIFHYSDKSWIDYLKLQRNLCSHPSINSDSSSLYNPLREEVQGLIKKVLVNCLILPPLYLQDIQVALIRDVCELGLQSEEQMKTYLEAAYFKNLSLLKYKKIIQFLWKLVVSDEDARTKDNIKVISLTLKIMMTHNHFMNLLKDEENHHIFDIKNIIPGRELYLLYALNDTLRSSLNTSYKYPLEQLINKKDECVVAAFLADEMTTREKYIDAIINYKYMDVKIKTVLKNLFPFLANNNYKLTASECSAIYTSSVSFDGADRNFLCFINPILSKMTEDELKNLIVDSVQNDQCYCRNAAKIHHAEVLSAYGFMLGVKGIDNILKDEKMVEVLKSFHPEYEHHIQDIPF